MTNSPLPRPRLVRQPLLPAEGSALQAALDGRVTQRAFNTLRGIAAGALRGASGDADDVLHDAVATLIQRAPTLEPGPDRVFRARAYLRLTAQRAYAKQRRAATRHAPEEAVDDGYRSGLFPIARFALCYCEASPLCAHVRERLSAALPSVSAAHLDEFLAFTVIGQSAEQLTDGSPSAVAALHQRMHRLRARLREKAPELADVLFPLGLARVAG